MIKWKYYSYGILIISVFLGIVKFILGSKVLDLTDIYVPYYNNSEYSNMFFMLWKVSDAGGIGNAPISMLFSAIIASLGVTYINMQFVIFSVLVLFDFTSLFILVSYISEGRYRVSLIITFFILFIEFRWAGLVFATGLNFFLAFSPLLIYFFLRMLKSEISSLRFLIFISLSFVGASFELTEAFPYTLFLYFPVLIMAILQYIIREHNLNSAKIFLKKQLTFLAGMSLGLTILIYPYYPWILASIGVGKNSLYSLKSTYSTTNIFIANNFSSLGSGTSILGTVFGLTGLVASVFGFILLCILGVYVFKRRANTYVISVFVFILSVVIYTQLTISFPNQLFNFITSLPLLGELFITINEPAQLFFMVAIWEYFIVGIAIFDLVDNYLPLLKFLTAKLFKKVSFKFRLRVKRKLRHIPQIAVTILIVILFLNTLMSVSSLSNGNSSYTPYGNYEIQNYIPNYVYNIYKNSARDSINGPQKILLLPDYPKVERWDETSPLFFTFPPSNSWQMSLFETFINDIQGHVENGTGSLLGSMDIGYIVVVKVLNQSETNPIIGYNNFHQAYGILGNPDVFYNYLNASPDFRAICNNEKYTMFKNLNNTGLLQIYSGVGLLNYTPQIFVQKNSSNLQTPPNYNSMLNTSISSINILSNLMQSSYWSVFGKNITEEFKRSSEFVYFNSYSPGYYTSYLTQGFPVSPGMKFNFSSRIKSVNNSSAIFYEGFDIAYSNESIIPGKYWQNGIYKADGNCTIDTSGIYTVPTNVTYIDPWITFHNADGEIKISNMSIRLEYSGNNSSSPFTYLKSPINTTLSGFGMENIIESYFPNSAFILVNNTNYINNINSFITTIYQNSTSSPGLYIVPYYYLAEKYGYVSGTGSYSTLNPGSFEIANLSLKEGFYNIDIKISGKGIGCLKFNNKVYIYNTLSNGEFTIRTNVSSEKSLNLKIHDFLGSVKLYDILLMGPNLSSEIISGLNAAPEPSYSLGIKGSLSTITLNLYSNKSIAVVLKETFNNGWSVSYDISNIRYQEKPMLVNDYQMLFIVPDNSSNISFTFKPPFVLNIQVYITATLVPSFIVIAAIMAVLDKRKGVI